MGEATYDLIGRGYGKVRRPDPRIAAHIETALGGAVSILNVGAGTGSYEPADREVTAVEPSAEMIAQRPTGAARAVQARAEDLPFEDGSFDAAMAIITIQHWADLEAGLAEMVRVARERVVILTLEPKPPSDLWLRDYFPGAFEAHAAAMPEIERLTAILPNASARHLLVPRNCEDGFFLALWDRPELHLDPEVRRGTSVWHAMAPEWIERDVAALERDLNSGRWEESYGHLRQLSELDIGLRLIISEAS